MTTERLIGNLDPLLSRKHSQIDYVFTQLLSMRGGFQSYLQKNWEDTVPDSVYGIGLVGIPPRMSSLNPESEPAVMSQTILWLVLLGGV